MRKSKIMIMHPEVNKESLRKYVLGHGPIRIGLRVAILQGIFIGSPIKELSTRHNISRQGIYNIIDRVNKFGLIGLEERHRSGRESKLTSELKKELKEILVQPPINQGYRQCRWDGPLVRRYLKEKYGILIGRSQVINWLHKIDFSLQRGRQKYSKANSKEQEVFIKTFKKKTKFKSR